MTDVIEVYRVEHIVTGIGPYRHLNPDGSIADIIYEMDEDHSFNTDCSHPHPSVDGSIGGIRYGELCGFSDIDDLHDWFEGYLGKLWDLGFVIEYYLVPTDDVRHGNYQVVFNRQNALSETLPMKEYRNA